MKIEIRKDVLVGEANRTPGEIIDVEPAIARRLVESAHAAFVDRPGDQPAVSPPDAASRATVEARTGRTAEAPPPELTGDINPKAAPKAKA